MGMIAIVSSVAAAARDIIADPGGAFYLTAKHFSPAGDDAPPLRDDTAILVSNQRSGGVSAVGYIDDTGPVAEPGEKRVYARNSEGLVVSEIYLKGDGSGKWFNTLGAIELGADGTVTINGVAIDPLGNITGAKAIEAEAVGVPGVDLGTHTHSGVTTGSGNSGPPVPEL